MLVFVTSLLLLTRKLIPFLENKFANKFSII